MLMAGDYREPLNPSSLEVDGGPLYCRIRGGAFRARFGRIAMQQLSPYLAEADGGPYLVVGDTRHGIRPVGGTRGE